MNTETHLIEARRKHKACNVFPAFTPQVRESCCADNGGIWSNRIRGGCAENRSTDQRLSGVGKPTGRIIFLRPCGVVQHLPLALITEMLTTVDFHHNGKQLIWPQYGAPAACDGTVQGLVRVPTWAQFHIAIRTAWHPFIERARPATKVDSFNRAHRLRLLLFPSP